MRAREGVAAFLLGLVACAPLGPAYHTPPVQTEAGYKEGQSPDAKLFRVATPNDNAPRGAWWALFGDPTLSFLETQVDVNNQNIKQSEAAFRDAQGLVMQTRSGYFPQVTTDPSASRAYSTSRTVSGLNLADSFILPVEATWELNLWGRVTLAVRNAFANMQVTAAQLEGMRLSMQAELASDYFTLRADDTELVLISSATQSYQKALTITNARHAAGIASAADVAQAQAQLDSTLAQQTDLTITRAQLEHAIAVLIGQSPSGFSISSGTALGVPPLIPNGLPSDLLERRPDIASAERGVAAANANIGLARAAYFPTVSLTATGGFQNSRLVDWLTWPSRFWSIGADAAETLLSFGARRGQMIRAKAQYDETVAAYRQTALAAFQDVEDELVAQQGLAKEAVQQESAMHAADQSLAIEMALYKGGTVSFLDVITTENIDLTDQRAMAELVGRRMVASVSLIRALGGGWDVSHLPQGAELTPPTTNQNPVPYTPPAKS